jgi:hypothetical protein
MLAFVFLVCWLGGWIFSTFQLVNRPARHLGPAGALARANFWASRTLRAVVPGILKKSMARLAWLNSFNNTWPTASVNKPAIRPGKCHFHAHRSAPNVMVEAVRFFCDRELLSWDFLNTS